MIVIRAIGSALFLLFFLFLMLLMFPLCALLDLIDRVTGRDKERRELEKMMEEAHD